MVRESPQLFQTTLSTGLLLVIKCLLQWADWICHRNVSVDHFLPCRSQFPYIAYFFSMHNIMSFPNKRYGTNLTSIIVFLAIFLTTLSVCCVDVNNSAAFVIQHLFTSRHAALRRDCLYPPARPSVLVSHARGVTSSQTDYYI